MSQLNVDILTNRSGTAGPTVSGNLTVNGNTSISGNANISGSLSFGQNLNVAGIITATSFVSPSGGLDVSGVTTATRFVSTQATGTAPLTVSSTTLVTNLNADLLDGQQGSFYQDAGNLNAGSVPSARLATGTANIDTFLRGDRTWASITSYSDYGSLEQVSGSTRKSISAIYSIYPRQNTYNNWNTTGPWTTLYAYGNNGQTDAEQWSWFGLAVNPTSSDTDYTFGDTLGNYPLTRQQMMVTGNSIGSQSLNELYPNSTSYNPVSILMMPIRNNSNVSKSITIYGMHSSYWSSGHDGSSLWEYAPGQSGTYSGVTSGTWTNLGSRTGNNNIGLTWSSSRTIPANTTYIFMQVATSYYWTSSNGYRMVDQNKFYSLATTFTDPFIQVDSRMINTMRFADWRRYGLTATNTYQFYKVYNACADMYGNR